VQPLLVIFEDLHWIDSETQAFLDGLVDSLPNARLLLLVNYRPEYQHGWGSKTYYTQLRLDPLAPEGANDLLLALLGTDVTVESLKPVLIARTAGNPFFIEESVWTLVETKALVGESGAYRLVQPIHGIQVPASVQALLAARIDRLLGEDKRLLQAAAVIGKDVPWSVLQAVAGLGEDELLQSLRRLQAAELLYEAQLFPDLEYTFKHALTHEVAYGGLLQHRRQAVHARVTEVLERLYADRLADYVELLAHHALRAELWDKAVIYLSKAGRRAVQRSAHRMAAAFFEEALTTLRHLPPTRATTELGIDLRLELRVPLAPLGGGRRRLEVMREAQRAATDLNDQQRLALTLCHMIEPLVEFGEMKEAIEVGERAFELAQTLDDVGLRVLALRYVARAYHRLGDYARGIQSLHRSLELLGDLEREHFGAPLPSAVAARTWLAWCLAEVGEFAEGATVGREALRVAELVDQPLSRVHALDALGAVHLLRGELDHAITAFEHAVRLVRTWDIAGWFHRTGSSLALAYATAGRLAEALPLFEATAQDNWTRGNAQSLAHLGQGYLLSGQTEDARSTVARALELACAHGERANEALALYVLGTIDAQGDAFTKAEAHYRNAHTLGDELGMRPLVAHCHLGLGKLYHRTDKREQAQEHLTTATTMYRDMGMTYWLEKAEAEMRELG
jgi:tetratricopeptide (TPR) repeat protein